MAAEEASGVEREAKIVRTVNFTVRTQQYEQDYDEIRMLVEEYGGRIESLNTSGDGTAYSLRTTHFVFRHSVWKRSLMRLKVLEMSAIIRRAVRM